MLADFRGWLEDLASGGRESAVEDPQQRADARRSPEPEPVDLHTLVAQFTALRHEVNLQTKATRAAVEQTAKLLEPRPAPEEALRPLVKLVLDIADAAAVSLHQLDRLRAAVEPLLKELAYPRLPEPPHRVQEKWRFFSSLVGRPRRPPEADPVREWIDAAWRHDAERANAADVAIDKLRQFLAGVGDGYALTLRRVERVLPQFGLSPIECVGRPFDPDTMEVVELAAGSPPGVVLEEVRRGYVWNGAVFRFAQVKVAR